MMSRILQPTAFYTHGLVTPTANKCVVDFFFENTKRLANVCESQSYCQILKKLSLFSINYRVAKDKCRIVFSE